jgi:hypothetical protein
VKLRILSIFPRGLCETILAQHTTNLRRKNGGSRKSKEERIRMMTDILALSDKQDDLQIMQTLSLPKSTFYRYKTKIYKESKKLWERTCKESLEFRALEIKKSLDLSVKILEEIASDMNQDAEDRMNAIELLSNTQITYLKFLRDGPEFLGSRNDQIGTE